MSNRPLDQAEARKPVGDVFRSVPAHEDNGEKSHIFTVSIGCSVKCFVPRGFVAIVGVGAS